MLVTSCVPCGCCARVYSSVPACCGCFATHGRFVFMQQQSSALGVAVHVDSNRTRSPYFYKAAHLAASRLIKAVLKAACSDGHLTHLTSFTCIDGEGLLQVCDSVPAPGGEGNSCIHTPCCTACQPTQLSVMAVVFFQQLCAVQARPYVI